MMATLGTPVVPGVVTGTIDSPADRPPPGSGLVAGRVSIVLPAYNCEATIAAAVESCLAQSYQDVEVIVVNDGSTDGTAQVLEQFGSRIRVLHQHNAGLAAARNAGTRAATGEFVAWMDGDDLAMPERLRIQVGLLVSKPGIMLVSSDFSAFVTGETDFNRSHICTYYHSVRRQGGVARIYGYRDVIEVGTRARERSVVVRWGDVYESLLWGNFVHPPTVMVRRDVFDVVGFFDETIHYSSDYDLIIRIARSGPFVYVDAPLLRYRVSATQMSHGAAGGRMPLETARILEKVRLSDPLVYARNPALFRRRIAESLMSAAEMIGTADRREALRLLVQGVRSRPIFPRSLRVLAKILLPRSALITIRRMRRVVLPAA